MRFPLIVLALVACPWVGEAEGLMPDAGAAPMAAFVAPPAAEDDGVTAQTPVLGLVTKYRQRSVSRSRQFIVYCPDARLRSAVTSFVENMKEAVLRTLGLPDAWEAPIVINMEPPVTTSPYRQLSDVRLIPTEEGLKIQIDLMIREERFREIRFPQQVIRAVLLEIACRKVKTPDPQKVEPPGWLVEGLAEQFRVRNTEVSPNAALFRKLIETGRLPPIASFLGSRVAGMDATSRAVFGECAYSLIRMLTSLPQGQKGLGQMVLQQGKASGKPVDALLKSFPGLGSEAALEKWWTLGLARFSVSDRYLALSVEETEQQLRPLLSLELTTDAKKGTQQTFAMEAFGDYLALPGARALLHRRAEELALLQARGHPLMRPVVLEYQRLAMQLARGKTKRVDQQFAEISQYRQIIVERMDKVTDYLNWYEATQMGELSGAFDDYFRAAQEAAAPPPPRRYDPLTRYIDQVQREFE